MTSDRKGFGSLDKAQKIKIGAIIIVIAIVIYMIYGMVSGGGSSSDDVTPQPVAPQKMAAKPGTPAPATMTSTLPNSGAASNGQINPQPEQPTVQPVGPQLGKGSEAEQLLQAQQKQQVEYLKNVDQLQMLKIQRDIAETNQAIVAAELATKTARKSIEDLYGKPVMPAVIPASDYANRLGSPVQQGAQIVPQMPSQPTVGSAPNLQPVAMSAATPPSASYVVISVSMLGHRWSAVLGNGGKLYNVSIGDILPIDNSVVTSINKESVTLKKDGTTRKISLVPVI